MNSHWYYIEILAGFFWISIVISLKFLLDFQCISIGISAKFQLDFKLNFDWISNFRMNWNTRGALWKVDNDTYLKIENNASDQVGLFQVFSKYHMKCQRLHDFWNHPCCKQHVRWYLVFYMPETDILSESRLPIDLWRGHSNPMALHARNRHLVWIKVPYGPLAWALHQTFQSHGITRQRPTPSLNQGSL